MQQAKLFHIISRIDSTNNYAMQQVHAGLAVHGEAWLAKEQYAGRGQFGRQWESSAGDSLLLSIALQPPPILKPVPFLFGAAIALAVQQWASNLLPGRVQLKWPNDLYYGDKKAGGLLIETQYKGKNWAWSVAGIGINLNQEHFPSSLPNPVSFRQATAHHYDPEVLGPELRDQILQALVNPDPDMIFRGFNEVLYGLGELHTLKKGSRVFSTRINGVNTSGELMTGERVPELFRVGDVQWVK